MVDQNSLLIDLRESIALRDGISEHLRPTIRSLVRSLQEAVCQQKTLQLD